MVARTTKLDNGLKKNCILPYEIESLRVGWLSGIVTSEGQFSTSEMFPVLSPLLCKGLILRMVYFMKPGGSCGSRPHIYTENKAV